MNHPARPLALPLPFPPARRFLWVVLIYVMAITTGCGIADRERWPRVRVIANQKSEGYVTARLRPQFAYMDGTIVEAEFVPEDRLLEVLEEGARADMVIFNDPRIMDELAERRLLADPPWRFLIEREKVALVSRADEAETVRSLDRFRSTDLAPPASLSEDGERSTHLIYKALATEGLPRHFERTMQMAKRPGPLLKGIREGRIRFGLLHASHLEESMVSWARWTVIDPSPRAPSHCGGAVLKYSKRPKSARRLWSFVQKDMIKWLEYRFKPRPTARHGGRPIDADAP